MSTLFDDSEEQVWLVPDAEEDGDEQHAITDRATHLQAVVTARAFSSGRAAARIVMGNGRHQVGAGPIMKDLDFKSTCVAMLSLETPTADRIACAKAIGDLAQVVSNGPPLREAGAVAACVELLGVDEDMRLANAAADAIRHLACASQPNRVAAREAGALPKLVAMLSLVADTVAAAMLRASDGEATAAAASAAAASAADRERVGTVTSATAALRNLSFQNGPNRDLICFSGGLEPLTRIVAQGSPPLPPPIGSPWREAAYRAAGALENLSSDHVDNAAFIVRAGVVPAMQELLIGGGSQSLSQKAARKARAALYHLIGLDKAARHAERQAEQARAVAAAAEQAEAHAFASANMLAAIRRWRGRARDMCAGGVGGGGGRRSSGSGNGTLQGDEEDEDVGEDTGEDADEDAEEGGRVRSDGRGGSVCMPDKRELVAFAARSALARAESELGALTGDADWTSHVMRYYSYHSRQPLLGAERGPGHCSHGIMREEAWTDGDGKKAPPPPLAPPLTPPLTPQPPASPRPLAVVDDKASRTAIHLMFKRPPLCRVLASRMDADGRLVVERRSSSPAKEEEDEHEAWP